MAALFSSTISTSRCKNNSATKQPTQLNDKVLGVCVKQRSGSGATSRRALGSAADFQCRVCRSALHRCLPSSAPWEAAAFFSGNWRWRCCSGAC